MFMSIEYTSGVTIYAVIHDQSNNLWNGSSFEAYNSAHWTSYAIAFTEQGSIGYYSALVPAGIPVGSYSFTAYQQLGGTPATTDTPLGSRNFTVSAPYPTIITVSSLITSLRLLADDGPDSKVVYEEKITRATTPADGSNKIFRLSSIPVVTSSIYITIIGTGATYRTQTGFTLTDAANGIITFVTAPNPGAGSGNGVYADYNYQYFSDEKYLEFLVEGSENLQLSQTPPDPSTVVSGLVPALLQYGLSMFFKARYAQYASRYASTGGQAGHSVEVVGQTYLKAADMAEKRADKLRDDYYKKQGQSLTPAYAGTSILGAQIASQIDPISPPR